MKTLLLLLTTLALHAQAEELWRGTLHLAGGKTMDGVIEQMTATSIKFISKGDGYWLKIMDLPAATRGELNLGLDYADASPADKAAYTADLPRRQALRTAQQSQARAAQEARAREARIEARVIAMEQAERDRKQAELEAMRKRQEEQRRTEALERIALELQLRRLNTGR